MSIRLLWRLARLLLPSGWPGAGSGRAGGRQAHQVEGEGPEEALRALGRVQGEGRQRRRSSRSAFEPCLAATRKEPAGVAYYLNRDTEHPDDYTMYEQFKNVDAIASHMKEKHTQTLLKTIGPHARGRSEDQGAGCAGITDGQRAEGGETECLCLPPSASPFRLAASALALQKHYFGGGSSKPCCLRWYGPSKSIVDLNRSCRPSPACGFTFASSFVQFLALAAA